MSYTLSYSLYDTRHTKNNTMSSGKENVTWCHRKKHQKSTPSVLLQRRLQTKRGSRKPQIKTTLDAFFEFTKKVVGEGDKVRILDFGTFQNKHRDEQSGRNPRTGEIITFPALDRLSFRSTHKY